MAQRMPDILKKAFILEGTCPLYNNKYGPQDRYLKESHFLCICRGSKRFGAFFAKRSHSLKQAPSALEKLRAASGLQQFQPISTTTCSCVSLIHKLVLPSRWLSIHGKLRSGLCFSCWIYMNCLLSTMHPLSDW